MIERFGNRVALGVDTAELLDAPLGSFQLAIALLEQGHAPFVLRERLGESRRPSFQVGNDDLELFERLFEIQGFRLVRLGLLGQFNISVFVD